MIIRNISTNLFFMQMTDDANMIVSGSSVEEVQHKLVIWRQVSLIAEL